jgi:hypothetical protein
MFKDHTLDRRTAIAKRKTPPSAEGRSMALPVANTGT